MSETSSDDALEEPTKSEIQCKVCQYKYVSILKHLGQQGDCMEKYDETEIQEFKKISMENTLKNRQRWKDGNKNRISTYNAKIYQENKAKFAEKNRARYLKRKAEKAKMIKKKFIENEKLALKELKSKSPKECRRHNQFQKDWLVNHHKFLFEKLRDAKSNIIEVALKKFETDIEAAFENNNMTVDRVEQEVKDKDIDESGFVRSKYKELKIQVDATWNLLEDAIDNSLKEMCLNSGVAFICPRCIHSGKYAGTKCFFCERNFTSYDSNLKKKHKHPPSVCIKKCNISKQVEELSEYEKIREENMASNRKKLQEFKLKSKF